MYNELFREKIPQDWKCHIPLFRIVIRRDAITYRWKWRGHWYAFMQKL